MRVQPINRALCKDWCLNKHYARRMPPITYAFGLFIRGKMEGICTFGTPVSHTLRTLFDGYKLMELNRLVTNESVPKNSLSRLVSGSLRLMPKPLVVVSYADTSKGHHGYIYQATNWIYTGLSAEFKDYYIKGKEHLHNGTIMDMSRGQENRVQWLRDKFGYDLITIDRPRKHRYFYFLGSKNQRKDMTNKLPYKVEPYPKGDNERYDASYEPPTQTHLF